MHPQINMSSTVAATPEQVYCEVGDELVILQLKNGRYYGLNHVGTRIWQMIQKPIKVSDIHSVILREYEVDANSCQSDLLELLQEMDSEGLLAVSAGNLEPVAE